MATKLKERNGHANVDEAQISNLAADDIEGADQYQASVEITGSAPLLMHAWNVKSVDAKSKAAKGSKQKKSDDIESYVYRVSDIDHRLGIPGGMLLASLAHAGKSVQDPRSPRKSMHDLIKAVVIPLTIVAPFVPNTERWDYDDLRRVVVQRASITRTRPAMREGWKLCFDLLVTSGEHITPFVLTDLITRAGKFSGLGDYRPTYGRFHLTKFEVVR